MNPWERPANPWDRPTRVPAKPDVYDPTEGMAGWQKFAAGTVAAFPQTARGIGQLLGLVSTEEVDEANKLEAPLLNTGAGFFGNVTGHVAAALAPGAAIAAPAKVASVLGKLPTLTPKAYAAARALTMPSTIPGQAALGLGQGLVQPVGTGESRPMNALFGAGFGALPMTAIEGGRMVKNLAAPFTERGREKLAGRVLQRFASDPAAAAAALRNPEVLVPGSMPNIAEATGDVGLAQLVRTLENNPEANKLLAARYAANNAARLEAIGDIAGGAGQRNAAAAARAAQSGPLYDEALASVPKPTPWIRGELKKLEQRPSFRAAFPKAAELAQEEGRKLDPKNVVHIAHYTKLALDDLISDAVAAGRKQQARAMIGTRNQLVSLIESKDFAPLYRQARETHAALSVPVNQMDIGQELYDKLVPALTQTGGGSERLTPSLFAKAVKDADRTAAKALDFPGARMADVLSPEQLATVQNVSKDLARNVGARERGIARGSPTAQNLISQDLLRQTLGPLGLPRTWAESALPQTVMRPAQFLYKTPEERLQQMLAQAGLDPSLAERLLAGAMRPPSGGARATTMAGRLGGPLATSGMFALTQ